MTSRERFDFILESALEWLAIACLALMVALIGLMFAGLFLAAPARAQEQNLINAVASRLLIDPVTLARWHQDTFNAMQTAENEQNFLTVKRLKNEQEAVLKAMIGKTVAWQTTVKAISFTGQVVPLSAWETKDKIRGLTGAVAVEVKFAPDRALSPDGVSIGQAVVMTGTVETTQTAANSLGMRVVDVVVSVPVGAKAGKGKKK